MVLIFNIDSALDPLRGSVQDWCPQGPLGLFWCDRGDRVHPPVGWHEIAAQWTAASPPPLT